MSAGIDWAWKLKSLKRQMIRYLVVGRYEKERMSGWIKREKEQNRNEKKKNVYFLPSRKAQRRLVVKRKEGTENKRRSERPHGITSGEIEINCRCRCRWEREVRGRLRLGRSGQSRWGGSSVCVRSSITDTWGRGAAATANISC